MEKEIFEKSICTDSEFYTGILPANNPKSYNDYKKVLCEFEPVIVQICEYGSRNVTVYEHPLLGYNILPAYKSDFALLDFYGFEQVEKSKKATKYIFHVYMYYSPLDILCLFKDKELMMKVDAMLESGRVLRAKDKSGFVRPNIFFKNDENIHEAFIKIHDLKGFTPAGVSGLEATAKSWGVNFTGKDYKQYFDISDVRKAYKNLNPYACDLDTKKTYSQHDYFIRYGREDVPVVADTDTNVLETAESIAGKLELSPEFSEFGTIGNMTNQIGVKCLLKQLGLEESEEDTFKLASYLYPSSAISILDESWTTGKYLTNIDGGYCKHKRSNDVLIHDLVSDMDLKSAYASAMSVMPYGIGVPAIISYPEGRTKPKWTDLSKKISDNLIDNLWVARISTTKQLSFNQDLIFSKVFGEYDFEEQYEDLISDEIEKDVEDETELPIPHGQFQLLRNEIVYGTFTSDIKEVIDNYWKPSERKEFYNNIEVVALIFYPKNCEETNLIKFKENYKIDGKIQFDFNKKGISYKDSRGVYWYRCSMGEGWTSPLRNEREKLKSERKSEKNLDNALMLDASQNALKNCLNSTYGVAGSQYYQTPKPSSRKKKNGKITYCAIPKIGNVVAAANITAKVRVAAWAMSKSLNCHQLITDGGAYSPNRVWYWEWENKESRNFFGSDELYKLCQSNNGKEVDKGRLKTELKPLGGKEWKLINWVYDKNKPGSKNIKVTISNSETEINGSLEMWSLLDNIAYEKCKSDFSKLSCIHQIKFESKQLYKGALFQSQANYLFESFDGQYLIKSRGYNLKGKCYKTPHLEETSKVSHHPYETLMINVYNGKKASPYFITHFQQLLLSPNEKNKTDEIRSDYNNRGVLSGCPTVRATTPELISLSGFNWRTREQFEEWNKLSEKIKRKTGYKSSCKFVLSNGKYIEESELILNGEYDYTLACKEIQKAIDEGITPQVFYNNFINKFINGKNILYHPQRKIESLFA